MSASDEEEEFVADDEVEEEVQHSASEESEYSDNDDGEGDDDDSYFSSSDESNGGSRTLLWLCEEGQLDKALQRVREWDKKYPAGTQDVPDMKMSKDESTARCTIRREIMQKSSDTGNYALHEVLAGGTSGKSAPELVRRLVNRCCSDYPVDTQVIFEARPLGSNGRTLLHWCAWGRCDLQILRQILKANPESMCLRDNKSHGRRTPLDIAQRYWPSDGIARELKSAQSTYLPYRLRLSVHLCIYRHFVTDARTPFGKADRKAAGLTPRPFFVASVVGYAMQREMKSLAMHIISFVGSGAKIDSVKSRAGKKRKKT